MDTLLLSRLEIPAEDADCPALPAPEVEAASDTDPEDTLSDDLPSRCPVR
jgi:hypothetical protein